MIRVGVIGYGYWGPNLVRNFAEVPGSQVIAVSDYRLDRLEAASRRYPSIKVNPDARDLIEERQIDAVVIATPVATHYELAMNALRAGKHILVEKPITTTAEQALRLIDEAEQRRLVLMVDHTFVYSGAVRKIRQVLSNKDSFGEILYYDSVRVNLGVFQRDVNVLWDLAVHDLSIMHYLLAQQPRTVSATGMSHIPGEPENIAYITALFDGSLIAHVHVNWLAPVKVRRTLIGGSHQMIVYDDLEPSEKIKVYDKGVTVTNGPESVYQMLIGYRAGDMWAPQFDMTEALRTEVRHFIQCVEGSERPLTGGEAGLAVVQTLEAATQSMKQRGKPVDVKSTKVFA